MALWRLILDSALDKYRITRNPRSSYCQKDNKAGEQLVNTPSVVLGYLKDDKATSETFVEIPGEGRFLRKEDKGDIRKSPKTGNEHLFIVDRIKELIKVKGHQVARAELEAYLLNHHAVADCAFILVPDDAAGEVPKAFVVKPAGWEKESTVSVGQSILGYVEKGKARYKWIAGGIELVDVTLKSPSGKILRWLLCDREHDNRKRAQKM